MTEEDRPNPITVYDVTKVASERMGINYQRQYGLEFVSFRFATNYGPGKLGRQGAADHLSTQCVLIENPLAGESVRVPQGREQIEDMIYNGDLAQAVALGVVNERLNHSVYNIGVGYGATPGRLRQRGPARHPGGRHRDRRRASTIWAWASATTASSISTELGKISDTNRDSISKAVLATTSPRWTASGSSRS